MKNKINESTFLTQSNPINENNFQTKSFINPNISKIHKDLLLFKNDMLLDIRKIEERFNVKLTEQSLISSEQYDSFEKKLSELDERISNVNSLILNNNELTEKIKTFLRFKTKTEDDLNRINAKIISIQKDNMDFINNIERMINENLRYPGVFGKNAKFLNFRYFIDYTMKNFKDLKEFRDEIRNLNFNELRREINKDISDIRFSFSDHLKNSVRLINNSIKEFDKKVEDLIKGNYKNMKESEAKFEELKNNIGKYFSEYQTKFESLEKNLNDKYDEKFKEIDNVKNIKNDLLTEINDVKSYIEKIKSSNNIDYNTNIKTDNNGWNQKNILSEDNSIIGYQVNQTNSQKYNIYQKNEDQYNLDFSLNKKDNHIVLNSSFEKLPENHNSKIRNKNKNLSFTHHEIKKKDEKKEFDMYLNTTNKQFSRNNYSITNIANIKIKKVILPDYISKRKINRISNSLLSENKGTILISKDLSSNIRQKSMCINDNIKNIKKSVFNMSKINKQKVRINKNRYINLENCVGTINGKVKIKNPEKIHSLIKIKQKSKNNIFKNLYLFKKEKKHNLSFEKKKNLKDEQLQVEFRKTFNLKNNIKRLLLMNSRNFKENQTIQL